MAELPTLVFRILVIAVLATFLPLSAISYFMYRLGQRRLEVQRILGKLGITSEYRGIYTHDIGPLHFGLAIVFTTAVSLLGLSALFLSSEIGLAETPNLLLGGMRISHPDCTAECLTAYQKGALLVFGLGFLGAYVWGLQNIFRRYSMNDLIPSAYYSFAIRMVFASVVALLLYHAADAVLRDPPASGAASQANAMRAQAEGGAVLLVAFLIGMFPQRGVRWLSDRVSFMAGEQHPSVRPLPLDMIEGMTAYDKYRMEELGIDTCYDLAQADYIPLLLKTPYSARELIDWLLQAKLCVRFGPGVAVLRSHGYRTILDLRELDDDFIQQLARDTELTQSSLERAKSATLTDPNIERLQRAAQVLGEYWEGAEQSAPGGRGRGKSEGADG